MGFNKLPDAPSRGALTADFLTGSQAPLEYLQGLPLEVRQFRLPQPTRAYLEVWRARLPQT